MALEHTRNENDETLYFTQHFRIYKAFLHILCHWILNYLVGVTLGSYIRKPRGKEIICLKSELESKFSLMELTSNHRQ